MKNEKLIVFVLLKKIEMLKILIAYEIFKIFFCFSKS